MGLPGTAAAHTTTAFVLIWRDTGSECRRGQQCSALFLFQLGVVGVQVEGGATVFSQEQLERAAAARPPPVPEPAGEASHLVTEFLLSLPSADRK